MKLVHGHSIEQTPEGVVRDLTTQFGDFHSSIVIYFASSSFDSSTLNQSMQAAFEDAEVFGCSTSGEIVSGHMLKNSVVAMGLNGDLIDDVKVAVVENIDQGPDVTAAFASFEAHTGQKMEDLDFTKYVGLILIDGLRGAEESIMDQIGDLTNITFIGGSAGDDLKFEQTHVYANGRAHTNAAVLALLKVKNGFDIIKTQSFKVLDRNLKVTKADEAKREVLEFNDKPAAVAYAEAVGDTVENADSHFMHNPVGLMVGDEPYVRSPQQVNGQNMVFYCNVLEGMDLSLLESSDIIKDTTAAVESKKEELGKVEGLINFHCILRTLELESKGQTEAYGKIFSDIPTIGFSTYGEEYIGHINQTSTMLVFR